MNANQTAGGILPQNGQPGQVLSGLANMIISYQNNSTGGIEPGKFVARDTTGTRKVLQFNATNTVPFGLAGWNQVGVYPTVGSNNLPTNDTKLYGQNDMLPVVEFGEVYVQNADATASTVGEAAVAITASNGAVGHGSVGAGRIDTGWKWQTATAAGAIGIIKIAQLS